MSYLLDTHILIWSRLAPDKLSKTQQTIIASDHEQKLISTATIWEIGLKFGLGKLELGGHTPEEFLRTSVELGYQIVAPRPEDFASFYRLPTASGHKDPFDRMLVWQAIQNGLTLLSHDPKLSTYQADGLKVA